MNAAATAASQVAAGLRFAPVLPWWALLALAAVAIAGLALAATRRPRGLVWRALALALVLAWLAGPTLVEERRTPLPDLALLVVDQTESMSVDHRPQLADAAVASIKAQIAAHPGLELRTVTVPPGAEDGTRLFAALDRALVGLPRERLSAVIAVTDGQIHDIPAHLPLDPGVPLHVLLAGHPGETDRRLRLIEAPGYGVVGKSVTLRLVVEDLGTTPSPDATAIVTLRRDGEAPQTQTVPVGAPSAIELPITP